MGLKKRYLFLWLPFVLKFKFNKKRGCAEEVWFQHIYISKEKNQAFDIRLVPGV